MSPTLAHLLVKLYPRAWRIRYEEEFSVLLQSGDHGLGSILDIARSAVQEHLNPTQGDKVNPNPGSIRFILLRPTALAPIAMSLTALAIVLGHIAIYGAAREADEGAVAHLWQILMAGQLPVLLFFAVKWIPRATRPALGVIAIQVGAILASIAPVFYFNL